MFLLFLTVKNSVFSVENVRYTVGFQKLFFLENRSYLTSATLRSVFFMKNTVFVQKVATECTRFISRGVPVLELKNDAVLFINVAGINGV